MQVYLYQTAVERDSIRQRMRETLYQTADAGDYQKSDRETPASAV